MFFINTLFDSTFALLGVIIGSAFTTNPDLRPIIGTLVASSVALGISTSVVRAQISYMRLTLKYALQEMSREHQNAPH